MPRNPNNPFERVGYSTRPKGLGINPDYNVANVSEQTFSGHDLQAYFNDIKVGNLTQVQWTVSTETVGLFVMGQRDPVAHNQGKRVIVGSMMMQQYARHALIQQVFQLHKRGIGSIGDLWNLSQSSNGNNLRNQNLSVDVVTGASGLRAVKPQVEGPENANFGGISQFRGLTFADYQTQLRNQVIEAANVVGNQAVMYCDQIPAFDITLVGVNKNGAAAKCTLFGVTVTNETGGFTMNDLGNDVGMSFVCLARTPWESIETISVPMNGTNTR